MQDHTYCGTKLLGGASRGNMLFFDKNNWLDELQNTRGKIKEISSEEWFNRQKMVESTLVLAGIDLKEEYGSRFFIANYKKFQIVPENFMLMLPRGRLKGYESH